MKYFFISLLFIGNAAFSQSVSIPQVVSDKALLTMLKSQQAVNGLAIVMDNSTGKVVGTSGFSKNRSNYVKDASLVNLGMEPGGLMIPVSAALLMDNFGLTLKDTVDLEGGVTTINHLKIMDSEKHGNRTVSLLRVISESSNVGIAKLANANFANKHPNSLFTKITETYFGSNKIFAGIESNTSLPFWAFGYGLMLTPNQIISFYGKIAMNDASLFKNANTLQQIRQALKDVTSNGTAKSLFKNTSLNVSAKTATIQAIGKNGYASSQYYSAFIGYTPTHTCLVIIKCQPHAAQFYGAVVAGPVVREILETLSVK